MLWMISCAQAGREISDLARRVFRGHRRIGGVKWVQLQAIAALDEKTISSVASVDWMGARRSSAP